MEICNSKTKNGLLFSLQKMNRLPSMDKLIAKTIIPFYKNKRKLKHWSLVLTFFCNPKSKALKPPKKEYLRCKLIRGHKRILRQLRKCVMPRKTLNRFDHSSHSARRLFDMLRSCYYRNAEELDRLSETSSGPITDGRAKRKHTPLAHVENSFNVTFCESYFSPASIRESYFLYVELVFSELNPEILCDKFDFWCCKKRRHDGTCVEKWLLMKDVIQFNMISELGNEPIVPSEIILPKYDFGGSEEAGVSDIKIDTASEDLEMRNDNSEDSS
ncbi:unnamed protein product [Blepharisma stoltei]|uniref:Uncharacterized protein n=1 Tax=Blepharisma stoltei TaxID=1481888 RepID=A0AAU9J8A3_9CILI|nr:unnamed protein product [Blepharisma stoltei]